MDLKFLFFFGITLRIALGSRGQICPEAASECAEVSLEEVATPMMNFEELESKISRLERRLRAVEQPVWQISGRPDDWEVCAEGPCRCRPETRSISCWGRHFLDVPPTQLVPNDLLKLDLGSNQLTALHRDTFLDLTQLLHLDLSDNQIEHLPLNLFFSLHTVTHLRLSRNLLRELHQNQLLRMRRLHILDFSSNKLTTLPAALFLTTTTLAILDLSSNRIAMLPSGVFNGLRDLEELLLTNNQLSTLPGTILHDLSNLLSLRLEENRLQDLPIDFFEAQIHLRELNLRGNQFTRIRNGVFGPLMNLVVLELSANRITHIDLKAFEGLDSLTELQLGHNLLKSVTPGLFLPVGSLERLVLYANGLGVLEAGTFKGLTNMTILLLHANHLRVVHPDLLQDTPNLRKLQLEANYLSYLPSRFLDPIQNIRQLRLERNPWHCDCGAAYLATWLRKRYLATPRGNSLASNKSSFWDYGAGAVCRGPGALGGRLLVQLSFHELCEGQWASMRGLVPRLPLEPPTTTLPSTVMVGATTIQESMAALVWTRKPAEMTAQRDTKTLKVLQNLIKILDDEKVLDPPEDHPVVEFLQPEELKTKLSVNLSEDAASPEQLDQVLRQIARYSVKTSHPHFHNQLYGGVDTYGLAGAWLTEALNSNQYTFEVAPVFTLLECEVIEAALKLVGYPAHPVGDGILCPGGSIANMYGMVLARYKKLPDVKTKGLSGSPPLACFTSQAAHYSITKGAHWLGLGTDSIYQVKTDERDRMLPEDLKRAISEARGDGRLPFFVNATAGTTVLGAFDPLPEIASICRSEDIWLHVDACLGGTLLLSKEHRRRLFGIELSDSVSWNPHKLLGAPLQCSLFLVKGEDSLHRANSAAATYLFQQDKFYDVSWDTGDKSIQCGRKVDALKLWLMWKARGTGGLGKAVDHAIATARYFESRVASREGFRLVIPEAECSSVCFWYIPRSFRGLEETEEWRARLYKVAPKIKERMVKDGSLMLGYTPLGYKGLGNFFRMVITCSPEAKESSMDFVLEQIEKFGNDL